MFYYIIIFLNLKYVLGIEPVNIHLISQFLAHNYTNIPFEIRFREVI